MDSRPPSVSFGIGMRVRDIPSILTVIEDMFSSLGMFITTCSRNALISSGETNQKRIQLKAINNTYPPRNIVETCKHPMVVYLDSNGHI